MYFRWGGSRREDLAEPRLQQAPPCFQTVGHLAHVQDVEHRRRGVAGAAPPGRPGLQARASALARSIETDEDALARAESQRVRPIFLSEHRYQLALRRAELTWLTTFTEELRTGALDWPTHEEGPARRAHGPAGPAPR